ncbi:transporter substrate-binding domain-containing protein [Marivirga harenae]|uniref:substrate-binding periplasmic protein n=1 Tax=Marivirga harenae TaxID=2010992 RepID=UPI0026E0F194|nr:transporter substrate-binding domain-containing protein [Marivirga harenae]WKV11097.1 transporter substrate-binding domain-containing protein [Marivirga harenae]|tara:strand:+ start:10935 stop:11774 length:840 start_codon:yes stop_codon:yes gene_type:complete
MKSLTIQLLFLLAIAYSGAQAQISGKSWNEVKTAGQGELTCVYYQTPGLVFEENGKMQGVCIDIMNEFKAFVSDKYKVNVTFNFEKKVPVFTNFINTVRNGKNVMGVCNTSITSERKQYLSFSPAYMNNPSVLLSNQDAETLRDFSNMAETFEGYKAIIIKGSTHEKYLKKIADQYYPNLNIEYANSGTEVNTKLRSNDKYFTLIDFTEYFDAVRKKMNVTRHPVALDELEDQLGFIFPKGSDWTKVWEEFLTPTFKESVTYKKIVADNLGTSFVNLIR